MDEIVHADFAALARLSAPCGSWAQFALPAHDQPTQPRGAQPHTKLGECLIDGTAPTDSTLMLDISDTAWWPHPGKGRWWHVAGRKGRPARSALLFQEPCLGWEKEHPP